MRHTQKKSSPYRALSGANASVIGPNSRIFTGLYLLSSRQTHHCRSLVRTKAALPPRHFCHPSADQSHPLHAFRGLVPFFSLFSSPTHRSVSTLLLEITKSRKLSVRYHRRDTLHLNSLGSYRHRRAPIGRISFVSLSGLHWGDAAKRRCSRNVSNPNLILLSLSTVPPPAAHHKMLPNSWPSPSRGCPTLASLRHQTIMRA